jgi:shikimate kinase
MAVINVVKNNIILTGMPGAGKSTVGVLAAKALGYSFCDTDLLLQKQEGDTLQSLINKKGITRFLESEKKIILSLNVRQHVIATGGSVIYHEISMDHLKTLGLIVYLDVPYRELKIRITNMTTRGITMEKNRSFLDVYNERLFLYRKYAEVTVFCQKKHIEEIVGEIIQIKKQYIQN